MARERRGRRRRGARREPRTLAPNAAPRRSGLLGEAIRYAVVCAVLLSVAPPLGIAVAFFWGLSLLRRLQSRPAPFSLGRPAEAALPREERPARVPLRLAELVERECSARAARIAERGVELARELDGEGPLHGDPELLGIAVGDLLDASLAELGEAAKPRLALELGENLAGSEVWLRLRGADGARTLGAAREPAPLERAALGLPRRIARAHGGRLEAFAVGDGDFELLLGLPTAAGSDRP